MSNQTVYLKDINNNWWLPFFTTDLSKQNKEDTNYKDVAWARSLWCMCSHATAYKEPLSADATCAEFIKAKYYPNVGLYSHEAHPDFLMALVAVGIYHRMINDPEFGVRQILLDYVFGNTTDATAAQTAINTIGNTSGEDLMDNITALDDAIHLSGNVAAQYRLLHQKLLYVLKHIGNAPDEIKDFYNSYVSVYQIPSNATKYTQQLIPTADNISTNNKSDNMYKLLCLCTDTVLTRLGSYSTLIDTNVPLIKQDNWKDIDDTNNTTYRVFIKSTMPFPGLAINNKLASIANLTNTEKAIIINDFKNIIGYSGTDFKTNEVLLATNSTLGTGERKTGIGHKAFVSHMTELSNNQYANTTANNNNVYGTGSTLSSNYGQHLPKYKNDYGTETELYKTAYILGFMGAFSVPVDGTPDAINSSEFLPLAIFKPKKFVFDIEQAGNHLAIAYLQYLQYKDKKLDEEDPEIKKQIIMDDRFFYYRFDPKQKKWFEYDKTGKLVSSFTSSDLINRINKSQSRTCESFGIKDPKHCNAFRTKPEDYVTETNINPAVINETGFHKKYSPFEVLGVLEQLGIVPETDGTGYDIKKLETKYTGHDTKQGYKNIVTAIKWMNSNHMSVLYPGNKDKETFGYQARESGANTTIGALRLQYFSNIRPNTTSLRRMMLHVAMPSMVMTGGGHHHKTRVISPMFSPWGASAPLTNGNLYSYFLKGMSLPPYAVSSPFAGLSLWGSLPNPEFIKLKQIFKYYNTNRPSTIYDKMINLVTTLKSQGVKELSNFDTKTSTALTADNKVTDDLKLQVKLLESAESGFLKELAKFMTGGSLAVLTGGNKYNDKVIKSESKVRKYLTEKIPQLGGSFLKIMGKALEKQELQKS